MRKTLILALATLPLLLLALGGCQENAPAMQEIVPGLSYADSIVGTGEEVQFDDFVVVHYTGWLYDTDTGTKGERFDSSVTRGEPIAFPLGRSYVVQGWEKGLPGMKVGGKRTLVIGPEMGYGERGNPPKIPAGATLESGDQVAVHYTGYLWTDGEATGEFDSSLSRGEPYRFRLGAGMVIPGWDFGFEGMKVGTKARLIIPWVMAYGDQGRQPKIPAKADLCFDVELVEIEGK